MELSTKEKLEPFMHKKKLHSALTPWLNDWKTRLNDLLPPLGLGDVPNDHFTLGEPEEEINYWEKPWIYPDYDPGSLYDPDWMWNTTETIVGPLEEESSEEGSSGEGSPEEDSHEEGSSQEGSTKDGEIMSGPDFQQTPSMTHLGSSSKPYQKTELAGSQHVVTPSPARASREHSEKQTSNSKTRSKRRDTFGGPPTKAGRKRAGEQLGGASRKRVKGRFADEDTEAE